MQRRDFSHSLAAAGVTLALGGLPQVAQAQRIGFKEGEDYRRLAKPAPVSASSGQVEVVEFFSYSCIHCYRFEPLMSTWMKNLPADVKVLRRPVAFNPAFVPMQRLYFALEGLGLVDRLHEKVFHAIHEERLPLTTDPVILDWVVRQGVSRDAFLKQYNGAAAKAAEQAVRLQDAYDVEGTPALGVAGRFYISGQGPKTLLIADTLIAQSRSS